MVVEGDLLRCVWLNTLAHDPRAVSDSTTERDECCAASSRRSAMLNGLPAGRVDAAAEDDEGPAESAGVGLHNHRLEISCSVQINFIFNI